MIRDYRPEDLGIIKRMIEPEYGLLTNGVIEDLNDWSTQVYEESGEAIGFVSTRRYRTDYGLRIFVLPQHRRRGVGTMLWQHIQPAFADPSGPQNITAIYLVDRGGGVEFFGRLGFKMWFQMDNLTYRGSKFGIAPVDIRPYSDEQFDTYTRILGDSFCEMRRAHNFEPHNVYEAEHTEANRADMASKAQDFFMAWDGGAPVGVASVQGDYIDIVGVLPGHHGKGIGKALTQFCVNLILDRGFAAARTSVVQDNKPARDLYYRLGFEHDLTEEQSVLKGVHHD